MTSWLDTALPERALYEVPNEFALHVGDVPEELRRGNGSKLDAVYVSYCISGMRDYRIAGTPYRHVAGTMLVLSLGHVVELLDEDEDYFAYTIVMRPRFIGQISYVYAPMNISKMLYVRKDPLQVVDREEKHEFLMDFYRMARRIIEMNAGGRTSICLRLLVQILQNIGEKDSDEYVTDKDGGKVGDVLTRRFFELLTLHYKGKRDVVYYADMLGTSPQSLTNIIKRHTGCSTVDWIKTYVINEAKILLRSTNKTIQEISYELNFSTQTFFSKYFKREVGISPTEYRLFKDSPSELISNTIDKQ